MNEPEFVKLLLLRCCIYQRNCDHCPYTLDSRNFPCKQCIEFYKEFHHSE
jgi:hypothetical protein